MLRSLRERWWYLLFWLPLCTALGFSSLWLWCSFQIVGGWTIEYEAAPKWAYLSVGVLVFLVFSLAFLFPRGPAWSIKVVATSICLVVVFCCAVFYSSTRVISYEVRDVDGGPLEGIPIHITHHANGVALTWFPGEKLLRTDREGKAWIRVFKSEECDANVNDRLGQYLGYNSAYSDDNVFFMPGGNYDETDGWAFGRDGVIEHSYMLEFQNGLPTIPQRCLESPLTSASGLVHVYLRHDGSTTLPPYFDQIVNQEDADPRLIMARLMSLGGSIESFSHLDELLSALSRNGAQQNAALYSLSLLALQIRVITTDLPGLALDVNIPSRRDLATNDQRQQCSQTLYVWLSGSKASPPLSHDARVAYIRQRIDQASLALIEALHPVMLKKKLAYEVLEQLRQNARPAMKFYPEVFEKGTAEAKEGALESIGPIAPSAEDIAFLIRSKNPTWIDCATRISFNSTAAELSDDLATLEALKSQELDAQNVAAFDQVIRPVKNQLAQDQASEARLPSSTVEPRYVVIDLGTKLLHPKKITNSGYVLGFNESTFYVWFDGKVTTLQPKNAGDELNVNDIDESGTVKGTERGKAGSLHQTIYQATWANAVNPPILTLASASEPRAGLPNIQDRIRSLNLPQLANSPVVPQAMNAAVAPLPSQDNQHTQVASLVAATQVIGNGPGGGYLWEMIPTLSASKTFEGPFSINILLPGEPKTSPWNVKSVADINDGGSIVGTAAYHQNSSNDPIAAGLHGVVLMPLAIVREAVIGGGDFEPIVDNGLDDRARIPIFGSAPPGTPNASTPETDGQGIFYIQMPGSIPASITLKSGDNRVMVQATPVKGRPNLLRTGKLGLIEHGDPFRASDITTIEAGTLNDGGNPTLELQKYDRTIVK